MTDQSTEHELKERIRELEERLRLMTGDPAAHERLRPHGFNPRQARALVILGKAAPLTLPHSALDPDAASYASIKVLVCNIRKRMAENSIPGRLETLHSSGYRADPDLAAWVLECIKEPETQPATEELNDATPQTEEPHQ